jgi:hypothetical protein
MSITYFPWLPNIPLNVNNNCIKLTLNSDSWDRLLENRDPVITCFNGLIESYLSLSYAEALNKLYPSKNIYINSDKKFDKLIELNNIAKPTQLISKELIKKYPFPLFFNDGYEVFFNCSYNYLYSETLYKKYKPYRNRAVIAKQIFRNSFLPWDINYIPKFRKLDQPIEFTKWKESKKFNIDKPFVLIFPDKTDLSIHNFSELNWSIAEVKSFISMCYGSGINSIIVTKNIGRYTGINSLVIEPKLEQILCLIEKCSYILSEEIDFLLIALTHSKNATIFGRVNKKEYSLKKNQEFFKTNKHIVTMKTLTPIEVYKAIK